MASEQKERILRFYRGSEGEETAVRLLDLAETVIKTRKFRISPFLDPYGQEIAETIRASYDDLQLDFDGGYQGAERARAMLRHRDFAGRTEDFGIACVEATWNGQFARLTHRDVLGAVMGLGIEREMIGDILPASDAAKILCDAKIAPFLIENLTMIGATSRTSHRAKSGRRRSARRWRRCGSTPSSQQGLASRAAVRRTISPPIR